MAVGHHLRREEPLLKKLKRALKIKTFEMISLLPMRFKNFLIRKMIRLPNQVDPRLQFKVAETPEEFQQAFSILYESYSEFGLTQSHPQQMRVTPYHFLPSTSVLIAKWNEEVVGTLSLVADNPLGLPADSAFDLATLRQQFSRVIEISSLAVKKDWRGRVLFPLLKYFYEYNRDQFLGDVVIQTNTGKWYQFYESVLLFHPVSKSAAKNYGFANGVEARAQYLDMRNAENNYYKIYGGAPAHRDLYGFFVHNSLTAGHTREKTNFRLFQHHLSAGYLAKLWEECNEIDSLARKKVIDLNKIKEVLRTLDVSNGFIASPSVQKEPRRKHFRFPVRMRGLNLNSNDLVTIHSISKSGVELEPMFPGGSTDQERNSYRIGDFLKMRIEVEPLRYQDICLEIVSLGRQTSFGARIIESADDPGMSVAWGQFVANFTSHAKDFSENVIVFPNSRRSA